MAVRAKQALKAVLLLWLVGTITVALQAFVGHVTIYSEEVEQRRTALHRGILENEPPSGGSWIDDGALSMNVRVGVIYLAEAIHRITDLELKNVYLFLDTLFLFASLLGLFFYLRRWLPDTYCLIGLLYFAAVLPLSYFLHYFHPYDRMHLALWILLLYLIRERRTVVFGVVLAISIVVKFDTILLPFLYFAVHATKESWRHTVGESAVLFTVALAVYIGLNLAFPAAADDPPRFHYWTAWEIVQENLRSVIAMNVALPPLLAHGTPLVLSFIALRRRTRFLQASVLFAAGLLILHFLFSLIAEVRAQLMITVLLLPPALLTLRELLRARSDAHALV
jgi:hypothetical protein